jgi:hypothetical protein
MTPCELTGRAHVGLQRLSFHVKHAPHFVVLAASTGFSGLLFDRQPHHVCGGAALALQDV